MIKDDGVSARFDKFCDYYEIPEKHHGSLRMLASMAFVLGFELEMMLHPKGKEEQEDD